MAFSLPKSGQAGFHPPRHSEQLMGAARSPDAAGPVCVRTNLIAGTARTGGERTGGFGERGIDIRHPTIRD